ncbi:MAG: 50S ribosomal protein L37ae, partial [Thermoplasmata archaeon]
MARRTKKLGAVARFGPRYGIKIRREILEIEREKIKKYTCPNCHYKAVKRVRT